MAPAPCPAYVEECDEREDAVRGTRRSASTKKKSKSDRESRIVKDKRSRSDSGYSSQALITGSEASSPTQRQVEALRPPTSARDERRSSVPKSPRKTSRSPLTHQNGPYPLQTNLPIRGQNEPSYLGISGATAVAPVRVAATTLPSTSNRARPQSYYGGMTIVPPASVFHSRPPPAPSAYFMPPPPVLPTSYPPPSPYMNMKFNPIRTRGLAERFQSQDADPIQRTTSASGFKRESLYNVDGGYDIIDDVRSTIRLRSKEAEDLARMPPPETPSFRRPSIHRILTESEISDKYPGAYDDEPRNYDRRSSRGMIRPELPVSQRRRSTSRSSTYDYPREGSRIRIEAPMDRRSSVYDDESLRSSVYDEPSRHSSTYDGQTRSTTTTLEDKLRQATGYQDEVTGGPTASLTAEALRKQQRTASSSRSTRSSDSHESDLKHSATTRTTASRLGPDGGDDVTIRFKGGATVNIAGAEIKCQDGAEVNILTRKAIRNGSEKAASEYSGTTMDDRRSRAESRPRTYSRSTSKSKSAYTSHSPMVPARGYGFF
jgi:hypothetical protein